MPKRISSGGPLLPVEEFPDGGLEICIRPLVITRRCCIVIGYLLRDALAPLYLLEKEAPHGCFFLWLREAQHSVVPLCHEVDQTVVSTDKLDTHEVLDSEEGSHVLIELVLFED